jgi:hypothetical protein
MNLIDNLSNDANQLVTLVLEDGTSVSMSLQYMPTIQRWAAGFTYGNFSATGLNLCIHPNLLRSWRNVIPFGIACNTIDGADPLYIDDFASGRASIYLLTAAEVADFETEIIGVPTP